MTFDDWLNQAWNDHATDASAVAARIDDQGLALAATDAERVALARLSQHVMGGHLARWADGRTQLARIGQPVGAPADQATLRLLDAGLALAGGLPEPPADLPASDRVRVVAMAAGHLADHDAARTATLLQQALDEADAAGLPDTDPALRSLAANANAIACAMEDKPVRSDDERALMIQAARAARTHWARAGTWLEVERAEYRLAMSWLKADDLPQARRHAQACLEVVREHDAAALEHFFAWEALGRVERAAGNPTGHAHALAQAREAFARLDPGDTGWCQPSLTALEA